ncbi:transposase [Rhizobium sp. R72]|uniref:transposase n=1 Tax=unclassified Rhizobium TaxID=2613769 RepID=UPI000B52CDDA|nr:MULTISPECIES: transposase [unclassified Rhizobium]OWV95535.1 transposase [Rhizobium sp. R72]OWV95835.1 transposase [Rhizobium sp. R711]
MMGCQVAPAQLFYDFCLDDHVPANHLLRGIDRHLELDSVRAQLRPFYSGTGRPSIDPELMMRMLIIGYSMGIRSERRLCEEVHLNLAYRWFCRLGLDGKVPDHSSFSKNRHGRFRQSDIRRHMFETVVERCLAQGLVGAEGFAVDASLIAADANKQRSVPGSEWEAKEESRFGLRPGYIAADSAYGSADNLAWLVKEKKIAPHIPVFDKSNRTDGTFSRSDFTWEAENDRYICPAGKELKQFHRTYATPRSGITAKGTRLYRASKRDCDHCELKPQCCPNMPLRKIPRDLNEDARDVARAIAATPQYEQSRHRRKKVEMLFAHLRILRMARLRLRGPCGARDEFLLAATAQNLRRLAKLRPLHGVIAA